MPIAPVASQLRIREFEDQDLPQVAELFARGMMEYSLDPALEHRWLAYIRKSLGSDLADVRGTYAVPGGGFWVATLPDASGDSGERVVGMVGLERKAATHGELRRLSVDSRVQGLGLGRRLVAHLEHWAASHGVETVELHVSHELPRPLAFYRKLGYRHERTFAFWESPRYDAFAMVKRLEG